MAIAVFPVAVAYVVCPSERNGRRLICACLTSNVALTAVVAVPGGGVMRKLLLVGISAVSACLLQSNAASALPGAPKSLATSASIGGDLFQQVHSRKHRHRHRYHAYRGYRGYPIGPYPYAAYSYPVYVPLYYGHHLGGHLSSGHNFGGHLQHHGHH